VPPSLSLVAPWYFTFRFPGLGFQRFFPAICEGSGEFLLHLFFSPQYSPRGPADPLLPKRGLAVFFEWSVPGATCFSSNIPQREEVGFHLGVLNPPQAFQYPITNHALRPFLTSDRRITSTRRPCCAAPSHARVLFSLMRIEKSSLLAAG